MKTLKNLKRETETHTMAHTSQKDNDGELYKEPRRFRSNVESLAAQSFAAVTKAFRAK